VAASAVKIMMSARLKDCFGERFPTINRYSQAASKTLARYRPVIISPLGVGD
jgi:hypothetical protein